MDPLGDDVGRELRRLGPQAEIGAAADAWAAAVGPEIARNASPARVQRDGTLIVHTRDAVWAFELTQRAVEIASRLPNGPTLKFVTGPLAEPGQEDAVEPPPPPLVTTPEQAREAAGWAASIEDESLREVVARAARASLARAAADRSF
ncbi:MAG TPA: DciA family protein [Gaiellaceae bacterium]